MQVVSFHTVVLTCVQYMYCTNVELYKMCSTGTYNHDIGNNSSWKCRQLYWSSFTHSLSPSHTDTHAYMHAPIHTHTHTHTITANYSHGTTHSYHHMEQWSWLSIRTIFLGTCKKTRFCRLKTIPIHALVCRL